MRAGQRQRVCQYCGETEKESFDPEGTLRRKAKGDAVREIQQLLADQGYLKKKGVDGSYGSGTETAIKLFQKDQGLVPDGVAWPQTIEALRHEFGAWETVTELSRFSDSVTVPSAISTGRSGQSERIQRREDFPSRPKPQISMRLPSNSDFQRSRFIGFSSPQATASAGSDTLPAQDSRG